MTTTRESAPDALSPAETPQKARDRHWASRLDDAVSGNSGSAAWIRAQRRAARIGALKADRRILLDRKLPGWNAAPSDRWMETATDLIDYEDLNGSLPAASGTEEARRLWRWLTYQQARHAAGKLARERRKWLDKKLPGWAAAKAGQRGG